MTNVVRRENGEFFSLPHNEIRQQVDLLAVRWNARNFNNLMRPRTRVSKHLCGKVHENIMRRAEEMEKIMRRNMYLPKESTTLGRVKLVVRKWESTHEDLFIFGEWFYLVLLLSVNFVWGMEISTAASVRQRWCANWVSCSHRRSPKFSILSTYLIYNLDTYLLVSASIRRDNLGAFSPSCVLLITL